MHQSVPQGQGLVPPGQSGVCLAGTFEYNGHTGLWLWSEEVYAIHGYLPGEVVPTTELILAHTHPQDRDRTRQLLSTGPATRTTFSNYRRLIDFRGREHTVLAAGTALAGPGTTTSICGVLSDLTEMIRNERGAAGDEAVHRALEHRPGIEQVKGALMLRYGITEHAAFELLSRYSQQHNLKTSQLACTLARQMIRTPRVLDTLLPAPQNKPVQ